MFITSPKPQVPARSMARRDSEPLFKNLDEAQEFRDNQARRAAETARRQTPEYKAAEAQRLAKEAESAKVEAQADLAERDSRVDQVFQTVSQALSAPNGQEICSARTVNGFEREVLLPDQSRLHTIQHSATGKLISAKVTTVVQTNADTKTSTSSMRMTNASVGYEVAARSGPMGQVLAWVAKSLQIPAPRVPCVEYSTSQVNEQKEAWHGTFQTTSVALGSHEALDQTYLSSPGFLCEVKPEEEARRQATLTGQWFIS